MSSPVRSLYGIVTLVNCTESAGAAGAPETTEHLLEHGCKLAYNLDHSAAVDILTHATEKDPHNPATHRSIAAIRWLRIIFLRGGILVDS